MINTRTGLAVAALAVGAGAVLFLSTNSPQAGGNVPGLGPVPVAPIGMPLPAEPLRVVPAAVPAAAPATSATPAPAKPAGHVAPPTSKPAGRATSAPAKKPTNSQRTPSSTQAGSSAPTRQQPRPADTEPNGTGGWQLPACYEESCIAPMSTHAAPHERTDNGSGLLGDTLDAVMAPVLGLVGGL